MMVKSCIRIFCYMVLSCGLLSCHEDTDNVEKDEDFEYGSTAEDLQYRDMCQIIDNLCDVDSVNGEAVYDFKIGEVLDETKPTEYSVGCETLDEAIDFFRHSILGVDKKPESMGGGVLNWIWEITGSSLSLRKEIVEP